jgi:hypothetical protein
MIAGDQTPVVIGSPRGEHVSIRATRREFPDARDYWDGNWIYADVEIRVGAFRGEYEALLRTDEFARFHDALIPLYENLTGVAELVSMEDWIRPRLVGDGKGHIQVSGDARDAAGNGNRLTFELELDQTELRKFPGKGHAGRVSGTTALRPSTVSVVELRGIEPLTSRVRF